VQSTIAVIDSSKKRSGNLLRAADCGAAAAFDYASLAEGVRRDVLARASAIHDLLGSPLVMRTGADVVAVGLRLDIVHESVGRKLFGAWLAAEFQWKQPAASKFRRSALVFKDADCVDEFQPSALYILSRKKVPREAVLEAVGLVERGGSMTCSLARTIVARHSGGSETTHDIRRAEKLIGRTLDRAGIRLEGSALASPQRTVRRMSAVLAKHGMGEIFHRNISPPSRLLQHKMAEPSGG
jgi:hypothetical protein